MSKCAFIWIKWIFNQLVIGDNLRIKKNWLRSEKKTETLVMLWLFLSFIKDKKGCKIEKKELRAFLSKHVLPLPCRLQWTQTHWWFTTYPSTGKGPLHCRAPWQVPLAKMLEWHEMTKLWIRLINMLWQFEINETNY